ncbi:SDR family oxidoreductase [Verminephrobacter aporrectodeae]|uniref:SDR family oxidoreductase n=1 Tax=Verminephrobacter aporrectodeae subsp. tuberculatae TaxID=1110392 RepID=A0ABT3KV04_9BURK|nr:SDR family oxidoreductase [Verminephrobacter aporrectodeae]MCW5223096.1 SDR family oxidoreductase [Verminephrobacter aporrectodeae subsp. tuberculatae]MCW5256685.1 SDR family oxidoreductase [Verminephrobacter aporrectodeae subsp. tuberculatae]MCW5288560.1 SDR family oxidoreductase [Verminephrobacter aporrectodeae subsp. tuberculatae]MCW5322148.1 SDR family oxidoreductase [Verminephrobacter aporrectodeae subsp. tuberculatae]MCW8166994.1 SDR family oxidoreductase [Verminephrobacter aporrectod
MGLVFITGASSGIGQALALRFHRAGYRLALVARRSAELSAWADAEKISADRCEIYAADVTRIESIVAAGQECIARQGLPDVVIANAGISVGMDSAVRGDIDVMARTFATNTVGMAATFQPFVAAMVQRGSGTLVGIGSVAAIRGLPGHGAYCASKAAVVSYCESLRGELRAHGVRVVTLLPGYVDTPLTRRNRYRMPFLLPVGDFAERAFDAIGAGASYRVIPWQMAVVAKLLRGMPNVLFDKLFAGRPRKQRHGEQ